MRSGQIGKVAANWGTLSPEASQSLSGWRTRAERAANFGQLLDDLSRGLSSWDHSDREGALTEAIDVLARGMMAERIFFFIAVDPKASASCDRFECLRDWQEMGSSPAKSRHCGSEGVGFDLESLPEQGAKLRNGHPMQVAAAISTSKPVLSSSTKRMTSWSRLQTVLYLPCVGPTGLLGFFAVESGVRVDDWSESSLHQATLVGSLFAGFLERVRLAQELDGIRRQMSRGEQLETLGLVASSVAHDFNNVLTAILGYADLAGMEIAEEGPGQLEISEIRRAATRAAELVEEVLAPNRHLASGSGAVFIDLSEAIGRLEGMLGRIVGGSVDVELNLDDRIGRVHVDPSHLERALFNLASNARDALARTPGAGGRFELSTALVEVDAEGCDSETGGILSGTAASDLMPGRYVRLSVHDDGCGIDRDARSRIFEPFFTTRVKGTGLGLAFVAEFMEEAAGTIRVESTPGEGTSFHLYFPVEPVEPADSIDRV